ncbi:MAG: 3-oxoacyl-[acyl-carrier-protein] reductase [Anaerovoracaceae bacterium]
MLKGKSAIITGGVRGIGRAIAEEYAKNGVDLLLCYRSNDEVAEKVAEELRTHGVKVELCKGDVSDPENAKAAVAKAKDSFGKIDILVNNAGITNDKLLMRMTAEDFDKVISANLNGSFYFLKEASAVMIKQKSGRIINISSVAGVKGNPGQVNYSASKAGVIGMTMAASKELGRRGITVNAIAPGFIETDMTEALSEEQRKKAFEMIPLGRFGQAEEVAKVAVFLAGDAGAYITGQTISVDGGIIL